MSDFLRLERLADEVGQHGNGVYTAQVLLEVAGERSVQRGRWGDEHDDGHTPDFWGAILSSYVGRVHQHLVNLAAKAPTDEAALRIVEDTPQAMRTDLVKVAAIAVAWVEAFDRKVDRYG